MRSRPFRAFTSTLIVTGVAVGSIVVLPQSASAATFTVTTGTDSGLGSLRQAILDANATPGPDVIDFAITPGSPPHTITLTTGTATEVLPPITDPVTIDATTVPGWDFYTPMVEIVSGAPALADAAVFTVDAPQVAIKGLSFNGSETGFAVGIDVLASGDSTTVTDNLFGVTLDGQSATGAGFASAVRVQGASGSSVADNLIANTTKGINLEVGTASTSVTGNIIGLQLDESAALVNNIGVDLTNVSDVDVEGNAIVGHNGSVAGVSVDGGNGISVLDNYIGTRFDGTGSFSGRPGGGVRVNAITAAVTGLTVTGNVIRNGNGNGVSLFGGAGGIGGIVTDNTISNNGGNGVEATGNVNGSLDLGGNAISSNAALGIATGQFGVNPPPNGPPSITSATGGSDQIDIDYDGPSGPQSATLYVSDNSTCNATTEGERPVATGSLALDANGDFTGTVTLSSVLSNGDNLTALVTPTTGVSTEYSACYPVTTGNYTPVAGTQSVATVVDTSIEVVLSGFDFDDDPLTFDLFSASDVGQIGPIGPPDCTATNVCTATVTYTPVESFSGVDVFTFTVTDSVATSDPAPVTVNVGDTSGADLQITSFKDIPDPVTEGGGVAYVAKVRNVGPDAAVGAELTLGNPTLTGLPVGTSFVSGTVTSSLGGEGTCTQVGPDPVTCTFDSGDIVPLRTGEVGTFGTGDFPFDGAVWTVAIVLDTPGTGIGTYDVAATVTSATEDPAPGNNDAAETTTVVAADQDTVREYVPPSEEPITVATAETILVGKLEVPVAQPGDTTAAALRVPAGGPGGRVVVDEQECTTPFCGPAPDLRPVASPPEDPPINDMVVRFVPPSRPYYNYKHPLRYTITYDRTTVVGVRKVDVEVLYTKAGDPTLYQAVPCVKPLAPEADFPCIGSVRRIKNPDPLIRRDLRVVLVATYEDPKIGTYR